jgi:hypothetical protein
MEPTPSPQVKGLLILHFALFAGQIIFVLIATLLVSLNLFPAVLGKYGPELILLSALIEVIAILLAKMLFKRKLKKINQNKLALNKKLEAYRGANITRWAILEGAALIVIVLFLLTNQFLILFIVLALLFIFYTTRPTAPNIATDLEASEREVVQEK